MRPLGSVVTFCFALVATREALASIGPVTDLRLTNGDIAPDGFTRSAVLAGGQFPGPVIRGNKGDRFKINVINDLTNEDTFTETSVHWHGLLMKGWNWADGGAMINQCPIETGRSFLYEFTVPNQAGTFWYHSHYKTQYCDGLRGALIVEDPDDPHKSLYDIDNDDTIITLADWFHRASTIDVKHFFPQPDAVLINGKGKGKGLNPTGEFAVVKVTPGKRYRFRLISLACDVRFTFSIDYHKLTIIEADGENTKPWEVESLDISAGQRYSVIFTANKDAKNYWIRAEPTIPGTHSTLHDPWVNKAILRYDGAPTIEPPREDPITSTARSLQLKETELHPLVSDPAAFGGDHPPDEKIDLVTEYDLIRKKWMLNKVPFEPPNLPVLLQILNGKNPAEFMPKGTYFPLKRNKTIEVTFSQPVVLGAGSDVFHATHPFHLHGHTFSVLRSVQSEAYNYQNPVRRDVVDTGGMFDHVTIRFRTDNPGPWFLHCHVDWHLDTGLAIIFVEDPEDTIAVYNSTVPQAWRDLCPKKSV